MRHSFIAVFLSVSFAAAAQENFQPGRIITLEGDTLSGQIDNQLWSFNPTTIKFSASGGGVKSYRPEEIRGFLVSDLLYRSFRVRYDSTSKKMGALSDRRVPVYKVDHVFLKVLLESKYDLLEFLDMGDRVHYFIKGDSVEELVSHPFQVARGNMVMGTAENKLFIQQLMAYTRDCESLRIPENLQYNRKQIQKIILAYAACKGYQQKSNMADERLGTITTVGVTAFGGLMNFNPWTDLGPSYGASGFVNFSPPNKNYKVAYRIEGGINKFESTHAPANSRMSITSLKFSLVSRIRMSDAKSRPFFDWGVFGQSNQITYNALVGNYYFLNGASIDNPGLGLLFGFGLHAGNFSPVVRYEFGTSQFKIIEVMLSYTLVKIGGKK